MPIQLVQTEMFGVLSNVTFAANASFTTPVIASGTATGDPTTSLGLSTKSYTDNVGATSAGSAFTTGDVKFTLKTVADTSWVLMNDTSIGNASSGASGRANADTSALFTLLWTNIIDQWAPVSSGRGASAAADFAANKTIALPKTLGRAMAGYGVGTTQETCTTSSVNGLVTLTNNTKWVTGMTVVVSALSGFTGTITATTYFLVRVSATNIRFATTLALAQAGTPDITIIGSGSATVTYTFNSRAIGEQAGEEAHAMSVTELLAHTHSTNHAGTLTASAGGGAGQQVGVTGSTGGNAAMNIMQPTTFLTIMVKL